MKLERELLNNREEGIKISNLILLVLAISFFPRIFTALGAPKIIDFFHFPCVILLYLMALPPSASKELHLLNLGIFFLFIAILISTLANSAGITNTILDFLLLSEPFLFFYAMVASKWSQKSIRRFKIALSFLVAIHIAVAYFQWLVLGFKEDDVTGVFITMRAGSHIAGAVSMAAGIYALFAAGHIAKVQRWVISIALFFVVVISDSKQVIVAFLTAVPLLVLVEKVNIRFWYKISLGIVGSVASLFLVGKTVYPALFTYLSLDKLEKGFSQKFSVFPVIGEHIDSLICWFFGLGPGHTISRLGWLMTDYANWLKPLGATSTDITSLILFLNNSNYLSNPKTGSSMFSLMFSWAGIWGDLGLVGAVVYVCLWFLVMKLFCVTTLDRFFVLSILVFGFVFAWLEEPNFMLFMVSLIGLSWQEHMMEMQAEEVDQVSGPICWKCSSAYPPSS